MRKNCQEVVRAWEIGQACSRADSIWTDGHRIMSYGTCIVQPVGGRLYLNRTRYSVTTSVHQNALAAYFGDRVIEIDGVPRGTRYLDPYVEGREADEAVA